MQVLNFGSLNIDRVLRVPRIARPGETVASRSMALLAGGKGANQSVALARAVVKVAHAGSVGEDGQWLVDKLAAEGIDTRRVKIAAGPTGQAMIQVDDAGQNAIVILGGANQEITPDDIEQTLADCSSETWLLAQNEISNVGVLLAAAARRGMRIAFNPAPFDAEVMNYPLEHVSTLFVNETEGAGMTGRDEPDAIVAELTRRLPRSEIVLTLGAAGAIYQGPEGRASAASPKVNVVDTTAAGDTFIGYFLAARLRNVGVSDSLKFACQAAAKCVTVAGALDSIPRISLAQASR